MRRTKKVATTLVLDGPGVFLGSSPSGQRLGARVLPQTDESVYTVASGGPEIHGWEGERHCQTPASYAVGSVEESEKEMQGW